MYIYICICIYMYMYIGSSLVVPWSARNPQSCNVVQYRNGLGWHQHSVNIAKQKPIWHQHGPNIAPTNPQPPRLNLSQRTHNYLHIHCGLLKAATKQSLQHSNNSIEQQQLLSLCIAHWTLLAPSPHPCDPSAYKNTVHTSQHRSKLTLKVL